MRQRLEQREVDEVAAASRAGEVDLTRATRVGRNHLVEHRRRLVEDKESLGEGELELTGTISRRR
jgi:hypothetical protein